MRLETTAGQLRSALTCMKGIVARRATFPVLSCVKFDDGHLIGTDLDMEVRVALPTTGPMEGACAIDYFGLKALARHADAGEGLELGDSDGRATVAFNGSAYTLPSLPSSDFPDFDGARGERVLAGNMGLVAAMRRVAFALSTEETRYYLNGVALLKGPDGPIAVATDGHRLAVVPLPGLPDSAAGMILPRGLVHYLTGRQAEPEAVIFEPERNLCAFEFPGLKIAAKTINGTYPDIFRVMPKDPKPLFSIDRQAALRTLRRLSAFMVANAPHIVGVKLEGGAALRVSVDRGNEFTASETIAWHGRAPETPFACGFNVHYIVDALSRLSGDVVTFAGDGGPAGAPAQITSDNDALTIIQMPMRV